MGGREVDQEKWPVWCSGLTSIRPTCLSQPPFFFCFRRAGWVLVAFFVGFLLLRILSQSTIEIYK